MVWDPGKQSIIVAMLKTSLLNIENRNKQLRLNHVFKIVKNKCPSYMKEKNYLCQSYVPIDTLLIF